ncbi:MAG: hypothetical protein ACNA8H_01515 [Anaerolineales bacterium]
MKLARILYRAHQFWQALVKKPTKIDLKFVESQLSPSEYLLFRRMHWSEQAHGLRVLRSLLDRGEHHPDLLKAALLHDVGKSCFPLRLWERVVIVVAKAVVPGRVIRWGASPMLENQAPADWRRGFIISEQHPGWGARMAAEAGMSPLAIDLIRYHQNGMSDVGKFSHSLDRHLLHVLQAADEES